MDGIHPPIEDGDLEVTLKTDNSDLDADTVISTLDRIIEDLTTTFETDRTHLMTLQQYQMMKKQKTQKQKQPLPN